MRCKQGERQREKIVGRRGSHTGGEREEENEGYIKKERRKEKERERLRKGNRRERGINGNTYGDLYLRDMPMQAIRLFSCLHANVKRKCVWVNSGSII